MSREGRLLKNTLILFVGVIGTKLINFLMLPLFTAWLSVEEYGIIDIFTVIVSIAVPICTLQLEQAVFRFMIDDKTQNEKIVTVSTGITTLCCVLVTIDIPLLSYFVLKGNTLYILYLVAVNLECIYTMVQQIIRGNGLNKLYSENSMLLAFVNVLFSVLFIRCFSLGVMGYVLAFSISRIVAIVFMGAGSDILNLFHCSEARLYKLKCLLAYSIPMIVNNVSWWILNASDKLVLNIFCGIDANGIYAAAGKIPGLITTVYNVFHMAWQEATSRESISSANEFYSGIFRKLFALLAYMLVMMLLLCRIMFRILIHSKFDAAYFHIPILLVALFFLCLSQFYGGIYIGLKESKKLGNTSAVAAIINLIVDFALVKFIGIYAASISTLSAYAVLLIIRLKDVKKLCRITYRAKEILVVSTMVLGAFILSYLTGLVLNIIVSIVITFIFGILYKDIVVEIKTMLMKKMQVR